MSWSSGGRRSALPAALLALAGCGFHPLYGNTTAAVPVNVQQQLESIRIVPSQDRMGQQIYNDLRDMLNPRGVPASPKYVLVVQLVETAHGSGRPVSAHAATAEGMRRATLAGVETIEHGNEGTPEVFKLMKQHGVALCPTIAASEAYATY